MIYQLGYHSTNRRPSLNWNRAACASMHSSTADWNISAQRVPGVGWCTWTATTPPCATYALGMAWMWPTWPERKIDMSTDVENIEQWATVELMGHAQTSGRISRPSDCGGLLRVDVPLGKNGEDRKSTRLNSSHSQISHA